MDARGQSAPLGLALVLAVMIITTTVVVAIGAGAISSTEYQLHAEQTEKTLTQLDSRAAMVAFGQSDVQQVDLSTKGSGQYKLVEGPNSGQITVEVDGFSDPIIEQEMGKIVYEDDSGTSIAYQGGGVWRSDSSGGSVMVSPPELHYRNATLTLPLITVSGDQLLDNAVTVASNSSTQSYPNTTAGMRNPISSGLVTVTVESEYYRAWAEYFRSRTTGGVEVDPANEAVTLTLLQRSDRTVSNAMTISGAGSGTLDIQSGATVVVDSYNSSVVPSNQKSAPSGTGSSDVRTSMNVNFNGNSDITGNLTTAGSVTFGGSSSGLSGNLRYGDGTVSASECASHVGGWCNDNASIEAESSVDNEIDSAITRLQSDNDNGDTSCFSESQGLRYSACGSSITLDAGGYYAANQDLAVDSGEKLLLDTRSGDIEIALDNDRAVDILGNVTVIGDGRVSVYATDEVSITDNDAKIWNRGWDARQFWVYCAAGCHVDVTQNAVFNGIIYAPPDAGGSSGDVEVRQQSRVYGSIIAGGSSNAELGQNSEIHFDKALRSTQVFDRPTVPSISYLHVRVNRINVTSG